MTAICIFITISTIIFKIIGSQELCCDSTSYGTFSSWSMCKNAADPNLGSPDTCDTCIAYHCIDWTVGSARNKAREASFLSRTNNKVYFGVGSYGNDNSNAGYCLRITTDAIDRDIIAQVVNQGSDVHADNFDLQTADGGFGIFDACSIDGTSIPQYTGPGEAWGDNLGGARVESQCTNIPPYPICGNNPEDNLQNLCKWSFQNKIRLTTDSSSNPTIKKLCYVACPSEIYQATGLRRSDELNSLFTCSSLLPAGGLVTRMMDCAKPSYGWVPNIGGSTDSAYPVVIPCRRDGYTRINTVKTSPTTAPSKTAAPKSTFSTTRRPTSAYSAKPSYKPSSNKPASVQPFQSTIKPSYRPTSKYIIPSTRPTFEPTFEPTDAPTIEPFIVPTESPTISIRPSFTRTTRPSTIRPSRPTKTPTIEPSFTPTWEPTPYQTDPSFEPSMVPTLVPSMSPVSAIPTVTGEPSFRLSKMPMSKPSREPTYKVTRSPSALPSFTPEPTVSTIVPSAELTNIPIYVPTEEPSFTPTIEPTLPPCICQYAQGCRSKSDCCPGLECSIGKYGSSSCIEPIIYSKTKKLPTGTNCTLTTGYGCVWNTDCCNPNAYCQKQTCSLFCGTSPTSAPVPARPTKKPTRLPSMDPSLSPTKDPSSTPTLLLTATPTVTSTFTPSAKPSRTRKPSTRIPSIRPSTIRPTFTVTTTYPSIEPSEEPTHTISFDPTDEPTAPPVTPCLCRYQQNCFKDSDCCPGLSCTIFNTYSMCQENVLYRKVVNNCTVTDQGYGCKRSQECCNPFGICNKVKQSCSLICPTVPTSIPVARPPTWTPIYHYTPRPVTKFIRPTKEPTYEPTSNISSVPTQPSFIPTALPTEEPTESPTGEPTATPTVYVTTFSPSIQLYTIIKFESILMLRNLTSGTTTLDKFGRTYIEKTMNLILGIPGGYVKYGEDRVLKADSGNPTMVKSRKVTLVMKVYSEISLSLFPLYASHPDLLLQELTRNLTAAVASNKFTQILHQVAAGGSSRSAIVGAVDSHNVTCINLKVQYPNTQADTNDQSSSSGSIPRNVVIGLVTVSVMGLLLLIGFIYWGIYYVCSRASRKRKALQSMDDSSLSDKPVWFDDVLYGDESNFNFDLNDFRLGSASKDNIEYLMSVSTEER